jgi:hypothetical protein
MGVDLLTLLMTRKMEKMKLMKRERWEMAKTRWEAPRHDVVK